MMPRLPFLPATLQTFALISNPWLGLQHNRCNEFVKILEIFLHQCDIYYFHVGCEPLVALCLNLQKIGMSWLCLNCRIYFGIKFKPTKNRYFPYVFAYIWYMISILTSQPRASIATAYFFNSLFFYQIFPFYI